MRLIAICLLFPDCSYEAFGAGAVRKRAPVRGRLRMFPETPEGLRGAVTRLLDEAGARFRRPALRVPRAARALWHFGQNRGPGVQAPQARAVQAGNRAGRVPRRDRIRGLLHRGGGRVRDADRFYSRRQGAVRKLGYSTLFSMRSMRYDHQRRGFLSTSERKPIHEYEHSIEMVLPSFRSAWARLNSCRCSPTACTIRSSVTTPRGSRTGPRPSPSKSGN